MPGSRKNRLLCVFLLIGLLCSLLPVSAFAEADGENYVADIPGAYTVSGSAVLSVYFDGLLTMKAYDCGGALWIPAEDIAAFFGSELSGYWSDAAETLILAGTGIDLCVHCGLDYIEVNNRYIYSKDEFAVIDGKVCLPEAVIEKIFGIELERSENTVSADTLDYMLLSGWSGYYEDTYGEDDVSLLTHLINAEAGNSSLAARVGVGNVVFNRLASDKFPDNVHDVIYDTNNGVQFAPTVNGRLADEPNELSYVAACLSFEGYNTVQDSIFFDDAWGELSWLDDSRFVCRIDGHCFYH